MPETSIKTVVRGKWNSPSGTKEESSFGSSRQRTPWLRANLHNRFKAALCRCVMTPRRRLTQLRGCHGWGAMSGRDCVGTREERQSGQAVGTFPAGARPRKRRTRFVTTWSGKERAKGEERTETGRTCLHESNRMVSSSEHSGERRKELSRRLSHCCTRERWRSGMRSAEW